MFKQKTTSLGVVALLCLGAAQARAAGPSPIDVVSWVGNELNKMVNADIGVFLAEGQMILGAIFAILLVWYLLIGLLSRQIRNELLIGLIFNFMLASMMLTFYDAPMPWGGGITFHGLFAAEAQWAAAQLDISAVNDVVKAVIAMWQGMEGPKPWDVLGVIVYAGFAFNLALIWLFCSGITLIAHIALGYGSLMGSLLIPFFIWPVMDWLFWGWVRFMTTYALYIISSSAVVLIYANVVLYFFNHVINGDYSLANMTALLVPFLFLNGVFLIAFWQCHSWARELASGSAGLGASVSGAVQALAIKLL